MLRPAQAGQPTRAGARFFKSLRQIIESVNNTLKAQLDLERHGGRTVAGVSARVAQRLLALTATIWHNDHRGARVRAGSGTGARWSYGPAAGSRGAPNVRKLGRPSHHSAFR